MIEVSQQPSPGVVETIFVATDRKLDPNGQFGVERSEGLSYAALGISVPPDRKAGSIAYRRFGKLDPKTDFYATGQQNFADAAAFRASDAPLRRVTRAPTDSAVSCSVTL